MIISYTFWRFERGKGEHEKYAKLNKFKKEKDKFKPEVNNWLLLN